MRNGSSDSVTEALRLPVHGSGTVCQQNCVSHSVRHRTERI